jgi:prepilin-type N-terminal cleavage/methylation domain-containing protein
MNRMSLRVNSGFTIIELVTVIALLGILAGIAIVSMGNPKGFQSLAEAEALKANLRFTQSKAMCDLPEDPLGTKVVWSLNITAADYTIQRNGVAPTPTVNLPGSDSGTYPLPSGISVNAGTGLVGFNFRGQPVGANGVPLAADRSITVYGAPAITITRETGFIP